MAKRKTAKATEPKEVPAAITRQIVAMKRPFMSFSTAYAPIAQRRGELAPKFMAIYQKWRDSIGRGAASSFVNYVREYDPSVPKHADGADGYAKHKSYVAATYLRRLMVARPDNAARSKGLTPMQILARTVASMLPLVKDPQIVWNAVEKELGITDRRLTNLQKQVKVTQPLLTFTGKPTGAHVIHMSAAQVTKARRVVEPETAEGGRLRISA